MDALGVRSSMKRQRGGPTVRAMGTELTVTASACTVSTRTSATRVMPRAVALALIARTVRTRPAVVTQWNASEVWPNGVPSEMASNRRAVSSAAAGGMRSKWCLGAVGNPVTHHCPVSGPVVGNHRWPFADGRTTWCLVPAGKWRKPGWTVFQVVSGQLGR